MRLCVSSGFHLPSVYFYIHAHVCFQYCVPECVFILLLRVFRTVRVCVCFPLAQWRVFPRAPQHFAALTQPLLCSDSSPNIPTADLNCHFHGHPGPLYFSPLHSSPIFLCAVFKLLNFQTCTLDSTCATKSISEWHGEISEKNSREQLLQLHEAWWYRKLKCVIIWQLLTVSSLHTMPY